MPSRRKKKDSTASAPNFPAQSDSSFSRIFRRYESRRSQLNKQAAMLTRREWQVLELIAEHNTDAQIAQKLGIGEEAVRRHTANMRTKLELGKRHELYAWYREYMDK